MPGEGRLRKIAEESYIVKVCAISYPPVLFPIHGKSVTANPDGIDILLDVLVGSVTFTFVPLYTYSDPPTVPVTFA